MLRFYVALLYADNNGLDKYIFNVAHHHVYYFFPIYIYTKRDKNWKLYYMVLAIICNIISRIGVMAQKIHMH